MWFCWPISIVRWLWLSVDLFFFPVDLAYCRFHPGWGMEIGNTTIDHWILRLYLYCGLFVFKQTHVWRCSLCHTLILMLKPTVGCLKNAYCECVPMTGVSPAPPQAADFSPWGKWNNPTPLFAMVIPISFTRGFFLHRRKGSSTSSSNQLVKYLHIFTQCRCRHILPRIWRWFQPCFCQSQAKSRNRVFSRGPS